MHLENGEFYLHIVWQKNKNKMQPKSFYHRRKTSAPNVRIIESENPQIRNFYFRPTTDPELFRWYFSIMSVKYSFASKQEPKVTPQNATLRRSFTFDHSLSRAATGLELPLEPTHRNSLFTPNFKHEIRPIGMPDPWTNFDLFSFPNAPAPSPIHRATINSPNMELNSLLISKFQDCGGQSLPFDCSDLIGQEDELDIKVRTVPVGLELSDKFFSCPPGHDTNPFSDSPQDTGTNTPASSNRNLFQQGLDSCPIYEIPGYEMELRPPNTEYKTSWINSPVEVPQRTLAPSPLDTAQDSKPIDYAYIRTNTSVVSKYLAMSGWLEKAGEHKNDKWRPRWFTLYNSRVTYSETPLAPSPRGHFHLRTDTQGFNVDTLQSKFHLLTPQSLFTFRIVTPSRVYHLSAQTEAARREWIHVISHVIALVSVPV